MKKERPYVMYVFFIVNALVFLLQSFVPSLLIENRLGMFSPYVILNHEYWRFVTPIVIHFGLMHFVFNAVVLYYMGAQCEAVFGHWRFALVYVLSGMMGNLGSFAFNSPEVLSGGASTSLFGLFGAFVLIGLHYRENPAFQALTSQFAFFILLNLAFGLFDKNVDLFGHIGGLFGGVLLGMVVAVPYARERFSVPSRVVGLLFFLFFAVMCFLLGLKKFGVMM